MEQNCRRKNKSLRSINGTTNFNDLERNSTYYCLPSNGKKGHFSETRLTRASPFPKRTNWEARGNRVSPTGFSSRVASRIGHPSSKLGLASSPTRRRGAAKKGNGRRVYGKKRPVIEVFPLESSTYARYSSRTGRCVASSQRKTKKNVQRCSRYSSSPVHH